MQELAHEIKGWLIEAGEKIKESLTGQEITVETKSDRKDLVTNLDKAIQDFLIRKILARDPEAKILGEENGKDQLENMTGRVYIIDPIDGTMNFVLEKDNFCVMLGLYEDSIGKLGFIYEVMNDRMLYGGPEIGVFLNEHKIQAPANLALKEGLLGLNSGMLTYNYHQEQTMSDQAIGVRMVGCAGIELMNLVLGKRIGYLSRLAPWDYAPGGVLLETLGLKMSAIDGSPLKFSERETFLAGTPKAYEELLKIAQGDEGMTVKNRRS